VLLLAALAALLPACSSDGGGTTPSPTSTSTATDPGEGDVEVSAAAEAVAELQRSGFSGVVLVDHGGEVTIDAMGVADREEDVPITESTVFDLGSLTKQLTAAAILRLQEEGRLSVDDPVGRHLDGLTAEQAAITLHQLLTHTAGLPEALGDDGEPIGRQEYIDLVAATPLRRPPGTGYEYSNVGYSLLAAVVEVVTGASYDDHLQRELLEPAGLMTTGYLLPDVDEEDLAVGYDGDRRVGRPTELPWAEDGPYWHLRGNGGILSTAGDVHRWVEALLGGEVLDADSLRLLFTPHTPEGEGADTSYGYGWVVADTPAGPVLTHNGGNDAFFADLFVFPDADLTVFLATNAVRPEDEEAAATIAEAVLLAEEDDG
jgi:CubicO group peptidase (beta-lactamase class C family)